MSERCPIHDKEEMMTNLQAKLLKTGDRIRYQDGACGTVDGRVGDVVQIVLDDSKNYAFVHVNDFAHIDAA